MKVSVLPVENANPKVQQIGQVNHFPLFIKLTMWQELRKVRKFVEAVHLFAFWNRITESIKVKGQIPSEETKFTIWTFEFPANSSLSSQFTIVG